MSYKVKYDADGNIRCRVCGCTEIDACLGGCAWVEVDLCSGCAATIGALVEWRRTARRVSWAALRRELALGQAAADRIRRGVRKAAAQ